jgi:L-lactate dehydrogenase complex protein LldF
MEFTPRLFKESAISSIRNQKLQANLKKATLLSLETRSAVVSEITNWEDLRKRAHDIKKETIDHLAHYLEEFERNALRNGIKVVWAQQGSEVCDYILRVARENETSLIVKSKSLTTDEIGLTHFLEKSGIATVETDLGEYIIQLADEPPSHITAPALHKSRDEIGRLFSEKLNIPFTSDPGELTEIARGVLRQKFMNAGVGISGVNFAVAETGTVVVVENEGNARLSTTLPKIHIAVMGLEKVIPRFQDLSVFLRILARSSTGQKFTSYVSMINSPRRQTEIDGPDEVHVVIMDNGRSELLADTVLREALLCIRCGACLNTCPVYQKVGGHTYGWVYPGPIGSVLTPVYRGIDVAKDLPFASSLCGSCSSICPVKIDIHHLLLWLRNRAVIKKRTPFIERLIFKAFTLAMRSSRLYGASYKLARFFQPLLLDRGTFLRVPIWSRSRDFPRLARKSFKEIWSETMNQSEHFPSG